MAYLQNVWNIVRVDNAMHPTNSPVDKWPRTFFSKAPETFRHLKAIVSQSVSKNRKVCAPETSCMKGTCGHIKNMWIKRLCSYKVWDFATIFRVVKLFGTFEKQAPGPYPETVVFVHYSHNKHPKYLGREFNHGHCISHNFFMDLTSLIILFWLQPWQQLQKTTKFGSFESRVTLTKYLTLTAVSFFLI